ncbi:HpcH/HpaI aldolase/citrate lyase family protein [Kordiimonas pumila]|uniref:HpcH/HpaI aldolase/citrate lyase family protein n=1 Tax=Kordiimonas pumila TaxID=2161677 RepID=A0ABV7D5C0_9PROT
MRSFLFVPGDSPYKFEKAKQGTADALILDLEDSVADTHKNTARTETLKMLQQPSRLQKLYVRINGFDSPYAAYDLASIMPGRPDGIVLPKCAGPEDINRLGYMLDALEAAHTIEADTTRIVAIVTETAQSLFTLGTYTPAHKRLWGIMWGAEDLACSLGAQTNTEKGILLEPYRLARTLCLIAASAAGVVAIDAVSTDIHNLDAISEEVRQARRDGFGAKAVIHPKHVDIVNTGFQPSTAEIEWAERIIEAFDNHSNEGVLTLDGKMLDKPHLIGARQILASNR